MMMQMQKEETDRSKSIKETILFHLGLEYVLLSIKKDNFRTK